MLNISLREIYIYREIFIYLLSLQYVKGSEISRGAAKKKIQYERTVEAVATGER